MAATLPRRRLAVAALVLAVAACSGEQPAAPAAQPATTQDEIAAVDQPDPAGPQKIPGTDAIEAVDNAAPDPAQDQVGGVDRKAFAGTFSTTGARIEFQADGRYAMTVHAASANADLDSSGTWTVADGGNEIVLDSDDKSEPDRRYAVVSKDEIRQVEGGQALRRDGAR